MTTPRQWLRDAWKVLLEGDPCTVRLFAGGFAFALGLTVLLSSIEPLARIAGPVRTGVGVLTALSGLLLLRHPLSRNGSTVAGGLISSTLYFGATILFVLEQGGWGRAATVYALLTLTTAWLVLRAAPSGHAEAAADASEIRLPPTFFSAERPGGGTGGPTGSPAGGGSPAPPASQLGSTPAYA